MGQVLNVVFSVGLPMAMIIWVTWLKSRERLARYRMEAEIYKLTLEKGHAVQFPEGMFAQPAKRGSALSRGVICVVCGAAVSLVLWLMGYFMSHGNIDDAEMAYMLFRMAAMIGIIPFMIGVAFLIIHFVEKKRDDAQKER